jgi:serine/threonine protein kinase/tetratricopeptide (TPR) repeat protein
MGEVFLCVDQSTQQEVALKLIRADRAERIAALRRFTREVRAMARLDHPSIAEVYDYGVHLDDQAVRRPFFVMENIPGQSLRQYFKTTPPLEQTMRLFDQMLSALAYAHARGVIHRDLKPENVLITRRHDGQLLIKILDFGIARMIDDDAVDDEELARLELANDPADQLSRSAFDEMSTLVFARVALRDEPTDAPDAADQGATASPASTPAPSSADPQLPASGDDADDASPRAPAEGEQASTQAEEVADGMGRLTQHNQCVGTPAYLAPEQIRPRRYPVSGASDLYAVGIMLFEYVCGRRPFHAATPKELLKQHLQAPVPEIVPRRGLEVPDTLVHLIQRLLSKRPEHRFMFAADVRQRLRALWTERGDVPAILPADLDTALGALDPGRHLLERSLRPMGLGLLKFREPPLVGREGVQQDLWQAFRQCYEQRQVKVVFIDGEAGIGKSRIARWLCESVEELGLGRAFYAPYSQHNDMGGLRMTIERYLGSHNFDREMLTARLHEELERIGLKEPWVTAALVSFLRPRDEVTTGSHSERGATADFALVSRIFRRVTRERVAVLHVDDAQSAPGNEAIELVRFFLEHGQDDFPMLLLVTLRSEALLTEEPLRRAVEVLSAHPQSSRITLGHLDREHMLDLIAGLLPLEPPLQALVADRCNGHPLFALQLLNHWAEGGWLEPTADGKSLMRRSQQPVPGRVNELVERRVLGFLERLEPAALGQGQLVRAARQMLECMAMLGESTPMPLLRQALAQDDPRALRYLDAVVEASLLDGLCIEDSNRDNPHDLLKFEHQTLRTLLLDWARARPNYEQRQQICARVKLDAGLPTNTAQRHHEVSQHYLEANLPILAWRHLVLSARTAIEMHRYRIARERFDRALDMRRDSQVIAEGIPAAEAFDACRLMIDACLRLNRLDDAGLSLQQLLSFNLTDDTSRGWVAYLDARITHRRGLVEVAVDRYTTALNLFSRAGSDVGSALTLLGKGLALYRRGQQREALDLLNRAVATAERVQEHHAPVLAEILCSQAIVQLEAGAVDPDASRRALLDALSIYGRTGNVRGQADVYKALGNLHMHLDNADAARHYFEAARNAYDACGDAAGAAHSLNNLGEIFRLTDNLPAAETAYCQALSLIEPLGAQEDEAMFRANLGIVQFHRRHFDDARRSLSAAVRAFQILGSRAFEAVTLSLLICIETESERFDRAQPWLRRLADLNIEAAPPDRDYVDALTRALDLSATHGQHTMALGLLRILRPALIEQGKTDLLRRLELRLH